MPPVMIGGVALFTMRVTEIIFKCKMGYGFRLIIRGNNAITPY